jgi:hypothetical protein
MYLMIGNSTVPPAPPNLFAVADALREAQD